MARWSIRWMMTVMGRSMKTYAFAATLSATRAVERRKRTAPVIAPYAAMRFVPRAERTRLHAPVIVAQHPRGRLNAEMDGVWARHVARPRIRVPKIAVTVVMVYVPRISGKTSTPVRTIAGNAAMVIVRQSKAPQIVRRTAVLRKMARRYAEMVGAWARFAGRIMSPAPWIAAHRVGMVNVNRI